MTKKLRWGVLSTGNIATHMVQDLLLSDHSEIVAVASRNLDKAKAFADKFGIAKSFGSYDALCLCEDVDIVYVATPHSEHYVNTKMALNANKHVLCEKPISLTVDQARACFSLAKRKNLFLMEALWMRFFPVIKKVKAILDDKTLGNVKRFSANFCIDVPYDSTHRLYNKALGGGALMDVGIYPLTLSQILFGKPDFVTSSSQIGDSGVDVSNSIETSYEDGPICKINSSIIDEQNAVAEIQCEAGTISICDRFFCPTKALVKESGSNLREIEHDYQSNGYEFEIKEVEKCISQGNTESALWSANDTIQNMMLMQGLRHQWHLFYPKEQHQYTSRFLF